VTPTPRESARDGAREASDCAAPGQLFAGRYAVDEIVGQGSFGRVFRARDTRTLETVALKEFVKLPGQGDSFLREIGILFELRHSAIIDCQTLIMAGSYRYIVCEYMMEGSLRELLSDPRFDVLRTIDLLLQASSGVAFAHEHNIIHRDLKPENILLTRRAGNLVAKVSDFGVSTIGTSLGAKSCIGSPAYMAPEQFYDQYDARVDVYALGVILYEILCGRRPFSGSPAQLMTSHIRQEPEYPLWVPKPLVRVLKKALAKKADRRYRSVAEFRAALTVARDTCANELRRDESSHAVPDVVALALTRDDVYARRRDGRMLRLDRRGRPVEELGHDVSVVAAGHFALVRCRETTALRGPHGSQKIKGLPEGAKLAISTEGAVAFAASGSAAVIEGKSFRAVDAHDGPVTAVAFVGEEQSLCVARSRDGDASLEVGSSRIALPEAVSAIYAHPKRHELICRGGCDPTRLLFVRLGSVSISTLASGDFSCDGDSFYAVTSEGDLATVNVGSARIARTRWESRLSAVAASCENIVWATESGRIVFVK
jgi:eukaryotic-like serine/threonine-protein kinase